MQLRASTEAAALDRAAVAFEGGALDAVAHASTIPGYVIGHREEAALVIRLEQRFGVPAVASCAAAAAALRTHVVGTVHLVHPPWFDDELDQLGEAYVRSLGFDAVATKAKGLPRAGDAHGSSGRRGQPGAVVGSHGCDGHCVGDHRLRTAAGGRHLNDAETHPLQTSVSCLPHRRLSRTQN
jgi:hypothetical protein